MLVCKFALPIYLCLFVLNTNFCLHGRPTQASGDALEEQDMEPEVDDGMLLSLLHAIDVHTLVVRLLTLCSSADYLSAMGQELKGGKAPVKRLTSHQKQLITKLIEVHGDNLQVGLCWV